MKFLMIIDELIDEFIDVIIDVRIIISISVTTGSITILGFPAQDISAFDNIFLFKVLRGGSQRDSASARSLFSLFR